MTLKKVKICLQSWFKSHIVSLVCNMLIERMYIHTCTCIKLKVPTLTLPVARIPIAECTVSGHSDFGRRSFCFQKDIITTIYHYPLKRCTKGTTSVTIVTLASI